MVSRGSRKAADWDVLYADPKREQVALPVGQLQVVTLAGQALQAGRTALFMGKGRGRENEALTPPSFFRFPDLRLRYLRYAQNADHLHSISCEPWLHPRVITFVQSLQCEWGGECLREQRGVQRGAVVCPHCPILAIGNSDARKRAQSELPPLPLGVLGGPKRVISKTRQEATWRKCFSWATGSWR